MTASKRVLVRYIPLDDCWSAAMLTLNRPRQLNAIDALMIEDFERGIVEVSSRRDVRALMITGAGQAFSAGGDLKKYQSLQRDPVRFPEFVTRLCEAFDRLRRLPIPVIGLVNGIVAAGGLELLLNCDLAFAASTAKIGDLHLNFGQMGGGGVLTHLPRAIGRSRALELLYSGELVTAQVALEWGLVNRVVDPDELVPTGIEFCQTIAEKSPISVANARYVLMSVWDENASTQSALRLERERNAYHCLNSLDAREGLAAFAEKRKPRYLGR